MFIEIALDDLAPTTLMAGRLIVASVALVSLMAARGMLGRLRRAGWRAFALGIINSAVPFTLIAWGQQHIDSGVAAIANATVPIWVALLAIWFAQSERATGFRIVGIVLGLVGVAVLAGAQPEVDAWAIAGTLAVVVASMLYAIAQARRDAPGWEAIASVVALGVAGTGVGILIFMKIISDFGPFKAGLVTYLLPVTALLYGALLLDEAITAWMVVGLVLILAGVALGSGLLRPSASPEAVEPARP